MKVHMCEKCGSVCSLLLFCVKNDYDFNYADEE